jgi:hypothetical protein
MKNQKGYTVVELVAALGLLACFVLGCAGLYVAWHFIPKLW